MADEDPAAAATPEQSALLDALSRVLEPLAELAVARGVPYAAIEQVVKRAFVAAAHAAHPHLPEHRRVSRISAATGINRREVTRLTQPAVRDGAAPRSLATEVYTRWLSSLDYRDGRGRPLVLPRQGPEPSFEALAQSVTRDVHPRSLLEELVRLQLAALDAGGERVSIVRDAFVPRGDLARMLGFLGANVGDHMAAAVANVLADGRQHFEQAIFADELSPESLLEARALITGQWQALLGAAAPALEKLIDADRKAGREARQRLRIGLYTYTAAMPTEAPATKTAKGRRR